MANALVVVQIEGRPPTLNSERSGHWRTHRESTKVYRFEAALRVRAARVLGQWHDPFAMTKVDVWSYYAKGRIPDTGACMPAVKAIIDGAVDGGLLTDDTPDIVRHVAFWAPTRNSAVGDLLLVTFEEIKEGDAWTG